MAWKSGYPNQCLRLGYDAKRDRTLGARFRESASYGSPLTVIASPPWHYGIFLAACLRIIAVTLALFCFVPS